MKYFSAYMYLHYMIGLHLPKGLIHVAIQNPFRFDFNHTGYSEVIFEVYFTDKYEI